MTTAIEIEGFTRAPFSHEETTKDVYRKGSGPAVVIMTEIPGITPAVIGFAERVVAEGFTVFMPRFFGPPGQADVPALRAWGRSRACASRRSSPCSPRADRAPSPTGSARCAATRTPSSAAPAWARSACA
jgi:dienelactone hydrolase